MIVREARSFVRKADDFVYGRQIGTAITLRNFGHSGT
jgi:hypothetical protein